MPGFTSPDNIEYPVAGDNVAPLNAVFQNLAESVQDAFTAVDTRIDTINDTQQMYDYRWANSAARAAQTGMRVGDLGFQVDTEVIYRYNGSNWRVWEAPIATYAATVSNFTVGNGSVVGRRSVAGGKVSIDILITLGSTSAVTGDMSVSVPFTRDTSIHPNGNAVGRGVMRDASASLSVGCDGVCITNNIAMRANTVTGSNVSIVATTSTVPFTWATSDYISFYAEYWTSE